MLATFNFLKDWQLAFNTACSAVVWFLWGVVNYWAVAPSGVSWKQMALVSLSTTVLPALRERLFVRPPGEQYRVKQMQAATTEAERDLLDLRQDPRG